MSTMQSTIDIDALIQHVSNMEIAHKEKKKVKQHLEEQIEQLRNELKAETEKLDQYVRASTLVGNVSDTNIRSTLEVITKVINRALGVIFVEDRREIEIVPSMYRNVYPHFNVVLKIGDEGKNRSFKLSGTGLKQIISFLFTITLIDARKGRTVLITDELMSGLHPEAKKLIRDLIIAMSKRFQFVMVEYNLDIGKQYEVKRIGPTATVEHYEGKYYSDVFTRRIQQEANEA